MSACGYDDEGEREHDCCDRCGRGSCPGSGSGGEDACTDGCPHHVRDAVTGRCIRCGRRRPDANGPYLMEETDDRS